MLKYIVFIAFIICSGCDVEDCPPEEREFAGWRCNTYNDVTQCDPINVCPVRGENTTITAIN